MISVTLFRSNRDTSTDDRTDELTLAGARQLIEQAGAKKIARKNDLPAFSFAVWRPGAKRGMKGIDAITALAYDVDDGTANLEHIRQALLGVEWWYYTTWSHTPDRPKYRICLAISRPLHPAEYKQYWAQTAAKLGIPADQQTCDPSRLYYVPHKPAVSRYSRGQPFPIPAIPVPSPSDVRPEERITLAFFREDVLPLVRRDSPYHASILNDWLTGEPVNVPHGERDRTMWAVCNTLARAFNGRGVNPDTDHVAALLGGGLTLWPQGAAEKTKFSDKLQRALEKNRTTNRHAQIQDLHHRAPYTAEEIASVPDREWIIESDMGIFVRTIPEGYEGPFPTSGNRALRAAKQFLSPNLDIVTTAPPKEPRVSLDTLMEKHGQQATAVKHSYLVPAAQFQDGVMTLPAGKRREITPARSETCERLFELLGAPPAVIQWFAWLTYQEHSCALLFIEGPPGIGKSLLAKAAAHLWTAPAVAFRQAMGAQAGWNDPLLASPLVHGDETLPPKATFWLREATQAQSHDIRKRRAHDTSVEGALRIIVTANNPHVFRIDHDLTTADLAAIGERILHWEPENTDEAAQHLARPRNRDLIPEFAAHFLWLKQQHPLPDKRGRFLIETSSSDFVRSVACRTDSAYAVLSTLALFWVDRARCSRPPPHLVQMHKGNLYVTAHGFVDLLDDYQHPRALRPEHCDHRRISAVLADIGTKTTLRAGGKPKSCYRIKKEVLQSFAHDVLSVDTDEDKEEE